MQFNFKDKVILITGGSRGIGQVLAKMFAEAGGRVVVNYRSNHAAAEATLTELLGEGHFLAQADLSDPAAVQQLTNEVVATAGRIDVLINNAGIYHYHPLDQLSYEEWQAAWRDTIDTKSDWRGQPDLLCWPADD